MDRRDKKKYYEVDRERERESDAARDEDKTTSKGGKSARAISQHKSAI
jgi:hypothetical protein